MQPEIKMIHDEAMETIVAVSMSTPEELCGGGG